jgi:hypothetical protein
VFKGALRFGVRFGFVCSEAKAFGLGSRTCCLRGLGFRVWGMELMVTAYTQCAVLRGEGFAV